MGGLYSRSVLTVGFTSNGQTYETLRKYSQTLDLDGVPVRTVSLEDPLVVGSTPIPGARSGSAAPAFLVRDKAGDLIEPVQQPEPDYSSAR